jgi:hypothetical protein
MPGSLMERLLDKELELPFSDNDIRILINDRTAKREPPVSVPFLDYGQLSRFADLDAMFANAPDDVVVLYWRTRPKFGHWTCVIRSPQAKVVECFDPLGFPVDALLTRLPEELRKATNQNTPWLSLLLRKAVREQGYRVANNTLALQKIEDKEANSCGRWVGLRIAFHQRGMSLPVFQKLMQHPTIAMTADRASTMLSMFAR